MSTIAGVSRVFGNTMKLLLLKLHGCEIRCKGKCTSRLDNEYRVSKKGKLYLGYHVSSLSRCRFLVNDGVLRIGDNVGFNTNCIIACHERIEIGDNVEFGPNVCVYDHDHDFRVDGGLKARRYKTAPVFIGDNTWVGANVIILKGTQIGRNCVIGAGSVVSGIVHDNSILTQKRETKIRPIDI